MKEIIYKNYKMGINSNLKRKKVSNLKPETFVIVVGALPVPM
jgi:hypothetical protein